MRLKTFNILLILLVLCNYGKSQSAFTVNYTIDDGLPSNNVYQALQDKKGYMWFATEGGVSKFDGRNFKNFTVNQGLPTNDIYQMVEDEMGRIWLQGASSIVSYIQGDSVFICEEITKSHYFRNDSKLAYIYAEGDQIEIAYSDFICSVDCNLNFRNFRRSKEENYKNIINDVLNTYLISPVESEIIIADDNYLVIAGKDIFLFNDNIELVGNIATESFLLKGRGIRGADNYKHKNFIYLPTVDKTGLVVLDIDALTVVREIEVDKILGSIPSHFRFELVQNRLQVQTNIGFFELDVETSLLIKDHSIKTIVEKKLVNGTINRFFQDSQLNIWISTQNSGVIFIPNYSRNKKLHSSRYNFPIQTIVIANNEIYLGNHNGEVYSSNDSNFYLNYQFNEADERINDIIFNADKGQLIVMKDGQGLIVYDILHKESKEFLDFEYSSSNNAVLSVNQKALEDDLGISSHYFSSPTSAVLQNKNIYVGSGTYVFKISADTYQLDTIKFVKSRGLVVTDDVIFNMNDNLLLLMDLNFNQINSFSFDITIKSIVKYDAGILALLDNGDIYFVDEYGVNLVPYQQIRPSIARAIFVDNGIWVASDQALFRYNFNVDQLELKSTYVYRGVNDLIVSYDSIFVATENGLFVNSINDSDTSILSSSVVVCIQDALHERVFDQKSIFNYKENNLKFKFDFLEYGSLGDFNLNVSLIAEDTVTLSSEIGQFIFPNLSPNQYELEYQITDFLDRKSKKGRLNFEIQHPWYRTFWFYLVSLLLLFSLFFILSKIFLQRIKEKEQKESSINRRMAELRLTALQSQMNPHFIFNSLNSIQYLIQIEDTSKADLYLSQFSELLRAFLENSVDKYTSIAKEVDLLLTYSNLEKLRFENKFDLEYTNTLTKDESEKYLIPTNVLQPLVENAINHGLFHLISSTKGVLKINLTQINDFLEVIIEDNGVGRMKSKELKINSGNMNRSMGTSIVKQKLSVLKEMDDLNVILDYIDLIGMKGRPIGTRVMLRFPIKEKTTYE